MKFRKLNRVLVAKLGQSGTKRTIMYRYDGVRGAQRILALSGIPLIGVLVVDVVIVIVVIVVFVIVRLSG